MTKPWQADELLGMVRAFQPACIVTAAAQLDIFTVLQHEPMMADKVALKTGSDVRACTILLDALVALELLDKRCGSYVVSKDVATLLSADSPTNVLPGVRHLGNCLQRWAHLDHIVQEGKPAERRPSIRGEDADHEAFIGAMDNFAAAVAPGLLDKLGPLRFGRLLDIGGASGTWTAAFLRAVPDATAVLFDLPEVIPLARRRLTEAGLIDRVTLVAGDYNVDTVPAGADFAWLSAVAHQNSRRQNRSLFARIHAALVPTGRLVIRDVVMDSSRTAPKAGALFAVNMLVGTDGGDSYALDEYREDLLAAAFTDVRLIHHDEEMSSLLLATKKQA